MRAIVIARAGGPEVLELREVAAPVAGPDEVRVSVRAAALNRADLLQRRGLYPAPAGCPADIPGLEFAGEVEACGARVREVRMGDRVMGILGGGAYAEQVCLHERLCLAVPERLGWTEAAAIPEAFLTAYDALFRHGRLAAGESVLLHAAASGVGIAAAQLARVAGAQPIGLSRTADKRRRLEELGLCRAFEAQGSRVAEEILRQTRGAGVDLILDTVGASAWHLNVEVLREKGRWVLIGLLSGGQAEIDLSFLLRKRLTLIGSVLRSRAIEEKIVLVQEFSQHVLPSIASGLISPVIDHTYPLERASEAHARMEQNANFGKIVLTIGGD